MLNRIRKNLYMTRNGNRSDRNRTLKIERELLTRLLLLSDEFVAVACVSTSVEGMIVRVSARDTRLAANALICTLAVHLRCKSARRRATIGYPPMSHYGTPEYLVASSVRP